MNQAKHRPRRSFSRAEGAASGVERDGDRSEQITHTGGETLDNSTRDANRRVGACGCPGLTDTYLEGVSPEWSVHVKHE